MAKRYTATNTGQIVGGDTEVWAVKVTGNLDPVSVWRSPDGTCRCTRCSGPLTAMLTSCPHAKAVKRAAGVQGTLNEQPKGGA